MRGSDGLFFTSHAHVLVSLLREPDVTIPRVAEQIGISPRQAQTIVNDLVEEGYVTRTRVGRRNRYAPHLEESLRDALQASTLLKDIIEPLLTPRPFSTPLAHSSMVILQQTHQTIEDARRLLARVRGIAEPIA